MNNGILSPLRYPGGKRRIVDTIAAAFDRHSLRPELFVEPFAGGASVALALLASNRVECIGLADLDALVASFWKTVFSDEVDWLIEQVSTIPVTLEKWKELRESPGESDRERALACLFLNRTSFSGVLNRRAGPIGGHAQASRYKIGCRFYRSTLVERLRWIATFRSRVTFVRQASYDVAVRDGLQTANRPVFYFDPPFFRNAQRLYRHWFENDDHRRLKQLISELDRPWLLSYDWGPEFKALYGEGMSAPDALLSPMYSAAVARRGREVLLMDLTWVKRQAESEMPAHTRPAYRVPASACAA